MVSAARCRLTDDALYIAGARAAEASSTKTQNSRSAQPTVSKQLSSSQLAGKGAVLHRHH